MRLKTVLPLLTVVLVAIVGLVQYAPQLCAAEPAPTKKKIVFLTGGHGHWNRAQDDLRTLLLNAVCWIAKVEVPAGGVRTKAPSAEEMEANLEGTRPEGWTRAETQEVIEKLNQ